jgi:hypothetical protein
LTGRRADNLARVCDGAQQSHTRYHGGASESRLGIDSLAQFRRRRDERVAERKRMAKRGTSVDDARHVADQTALNEPEPVVIEAAKAHQNLLEQRTNRSRLGREIGKRSYAFSKGAPSADERRQKGK